MPMIGVLTMRSPEEANPDIEAAFERSLAERGYGVGRNVTIERWWARGNYDRLPELAQEFVRLNPASPRRHGRPSAREDPSNKAFPFPSMLASFPASMLNQSRPDLKIPHRIKLTSSRSRI